MVVTFTLSVDYPGPYMAQGDLDDIDVTVTEEEYELIKQWAWEHGFLEDYPELDRVWKLLYAKGREILEESYAEMTPEEREDNWDIDELDITIQYPNLPELSDPNLFE